MLDPDQLLSLVPPRWLGLVVTVLACIKILDEIIRLIPDKWLAAHTTVQLVTNAFGRLAGYLGKAKVPPAALLLILPLLACKASPEVVALTSLRATAQTVADAERIYHDKADAIIMDIRAKAVAACTTDAGQPDGPCITAHKAPGIKAMRRADAALVVYAHLIGAGVDINSQQYGAAVAEVIDALQPLGILVKGGK